MFLSFCEDGWCLVFSYNGVREIHRCKITDKKTVFSLCRLKSLCEMGKKIVIKIFRFFSVFPRFSGLSICRIIKYDDFMDYEVTYTIKTTKCVKDIFRKD